jgi:alpha-L-fucosidase 2
MLESKFFAGIILILPSFLALGASAAETSGAERVGRHDVVWTSPSKDASGVMPLGNGDIAAGVYAIENGDLYLLLAKNDAFNYAGEIYKTGRVRVSLDPNPFKAGAPFRQILDLATGAIVIEADGVRIRVWADANRPVFHVQIASPKPAAVTVGPEFWKRLDGTKDESFQRGDKLYWYFAVGDRSVYTEDLEFYQVPHMASKFEDPYRFNTFGHLLESPDMGSSKGVLCGKGTTFDIRIHAAALKAKDARAWEAAIDAQAAKPIDVARDWDAHCRWWSEFWDRSWIVCADNTLPPESREKLQGEPAPSGQREEDDAAALAAQSYNVFRSLMACQSRGRIQTKFNGGLFTQQLRLGDGSGRPGAYTQPDGSWLTHEDDRLWGRRFTYQNQRLLYWPLLASGDFDLMKPFFDYYSNLLPMRVAITKAWFEHEGAYYRENIEPTGAERDCDHGGKPPKTKPGEKYEGWYHDYYFTSGLETLAMMLDYATYTDDAQFRDRVLVPFAREALLFFEHHYPRTAEGKLRLEPAQVLETYWVAVDPAPDVAGLRFTLDGLLAMKAGTSEDQARWRTFRTEVPEVPLRKIDGRVAIAPAAAWEKQCNAENGELYPVFPFRCFGLGLGTGAIVAWTMAHRSCKDAFGNGCWTQDQIHWAYAGRAAEARDGLARRFRIASTMCRFPLYGREGPDSCPDFDHFGAGAVALQRMLVQEAGDKVLLLPAWPGDWDVDFKLRLAHGAVISGTVKDGALVAWDIVPAARKSSVVVCDVQRPPAATPIPANAHPLRAGSDSQGGNKFAGTIARVTMFREALAAKAIQDLAASDRTKPVATPGVVGCWLDPKPGDQLPTKPEDFAGAVSFETWIFPAANESGRILDKITIGVDDGILLDTWPGASLRLIVGAKTHSWPKVLAPNAWHHVAVVVERGSARVYLDGVPVRSAR